MKRVHLLSSTADMGFTVQQVRADYPGSEVWVCEAELDRLREAALILRTALAFYAPSVSNGIQWAGGDDAGRRATEAILAYDAALAALDGEEG